MKYERRHHAYKPTIGGRSVLDDKLINDLKEDAINYIGTFSEYNPLAITTTHLCSPLCLVIKKNTSAIQPQKEFRLKGFEPSKIGGYHGSEFNCNGGFSLTKQDLFRIANAMDDDDRLQIVAPDHIDEKLFKEGISKVT